jgi:hypothetical protein
MSTITSGTVLGAGLLYDSDTTGNLVIKTGPSAATAATFHGNAATTFDGNIHVGNVRIGQTDFLGSFTANGWQRFPGGITMQWGSIPATSTATSGNITFPIPFPTAVFSVTTQDTEPGADTSGFDFGVGITYAPATVTGFSYSKVNGRGFYWMAIGH